MLERQKQGITDAQLDKLSERALQSLVNEKFETKTNPETPEARIIILF